MTTGHAMSRQKQNAAQCDAAVWKRDTLRYTGGRHRFKMHYTRKRCKRSAKEDGRCWQHPRGSFPSTVEWS